MASIARVLLNRQCFKLAPLTRMKPGPILRMSTSSEARDTFDKNSPSPDSLILSDSCVERLKKICSAGSHLRIYVEGGGCSGFQYKFDLEEGGELAEDDVKIERDGATVVVDETSLDFLKGSTVDYHTELIRAAFRIVENPKAEQGCSCGASFSVKLEL